MGGEVPIKKMKQSRSRNSYQKWKRGGAIQGRGEQKEKRSQHEAMLLRRYKQQQAQQEKAVIGNIVLSVGL